MALHACCHGCLHVVLQGSLPLPLAGLIIGRDVLLVGGAFVHRAREVRGCMLPPAPHAFLTSGHNTGMHLPGGLAQSGLGRILQNDGEPSTISSRTRGHNSHGKHCQGC